MLTKILIMRPGQPDETQELDLPNKPGYDKLSALLTPLLNGADLERVAVWADFAGGTDFGPLDMFVDGIGRLTGLARNEAATTHYRRANLMGKTPLPTAANAEDLHFICGPAILFSRRVWF